MKTYKLLVLATLILAVSCQPTEFMLNRESANIIYGENMSTLGSLDVTGDNHMTLYPGARIAMRTSLVTQLLADFTVDIQQGEGLRFSLRTVYHNFDNRERLVFDYTTHGCSMKLNENLLSQNDFVKAPINSPKRLRIKNDGSLVIITVDCDTVYYGKTRLNGTEFIIVETLPNTKARMYGINFAEVELIKKTYDVLLQMIKKDY